MGETGLALYSFVYSQVLAVRVENSVLRHSLRMLLLAGGWGIRMEWVFIIQYDTCCCSGVA